MSKLIDLTGQRFGRLVVVRREGIDKNKNPTWLCQCDCGVNVIVRGIGLRSGNTRSCGHCGLRGGLIDLTGQRFGRLIVVNRAKNSADGRARWLCKCDCGQSKIVLGEHLRQGYTNSCGCFKSESSSKRFKKHGGRKSRLYHVWSSMKDRCTNQNCKQFEDYGGRGIKVCKEWLDDFSAFQKWALANGYKEGLTIDRKDNDKGYSPDNCRWTDAKTQGNNKRNCRYITYKGQRKTVAEWSEITGIPHETLLYRLNHGWETERILKK